MSSARAPFSTRKPKPREFEEPPIVSSAPVTPEPQREQALETTPTLGGIPQTGREVPTTHLGEYHDPASRYKKVPVKPVKVIAGRDAPPQTEAVENVTEPTFTLVTEPIKVGLGQWASLSQRGTPDTSISGKPEATRFGVTPIKGGKDVESEEEA